MLTLTAFLLGSRARQLVASAAVAATCVASGVLECNPTQTSAAEKRGEQVYGRMCAVCHGRSGEGYKADQAPALAHPAFLASVSDDFLREAIANGRGGTVMSAWSIERGGPLPRADVDAVVAFLRGWATTPRAALDERPPQGDAARGAQAFARDCARCHGARGTGGPNVGIGDTRLLATASNGFLRHAMLHGRAPTPMPPVAGPPGAVEDLLALLRSWQPRAAFAVMPPQTQPARPPPLPLGPVPMNPQGPEPVGFRTYPAPTSIEIVKPQYDRHARMALLDARAPSDYASEHIAGAVSVPFYDPGPYVDALPRDAWLVCYCSCPSMESGTLAQQLVAKGFTKVTVLEEGLRVWTARKYPTAKGTQP